MNYPSIEELTALALQAGDSMRSALVTGAKCDWKDDGTPVTRYDIGINDMVMKEFVRTYPHITVVGEEGYRDVALSDYMVILDPIDGTIPLIAGLPISTFCIVVTHRGFPLVAVIHDPYCNRTWSAERGRGCFMNGRQVHVSQQKTLAKATISINWWKGADGSMAKVHEALIQRDVACLNLRSIAICGGLIASGNMLANIFPGNETWETGAMQLIVEEAGGTTTDLLGCRITYGRGLKMFGHVVSNGFVHDELLRIIAKANQI